MKQEELASFKQVLLEQSQLSSSLLAPCTPEVDTQFVLAALLALLELLRELLE